MWEPNASHPNGYYDLAGFVRFDYHDAAMMVLATPEELNSVQHMVEKGVAHLLGVPNTNKEAIELPFVSRRGNFSFLPVECNSSWGRGKRPSGPNLGRSHLQSVGLDHELPRVNCILCAFAGTPTLVSGVCSRTGLLGHCWAIFPGGWNTQGLGYKFEDYGLAN